MQTTTTDQHSGAVPSTNWRQSAWIGILVLLAVLGLFHDTFQSMVAIWWRSETFAHGFLIFPITAWLIWEKRRHLAMLTPRPEFKVVGLILIVGFGWLLARMVDVQVVQQLALISLLILTIWLILGTEVARTLMFPLGFLFFAVPIGEALIPPMMEFTADFTVHMLQLTGIPVYREGTFFSIPSGDWSVVEGCSGVRYLIASITLGCLYAYLTYRSMTRRLIFVAFAIVLPIIANGLRAYMIVMIAHLSDMKLALGVDHLIYGWVFFGIVIMIMFLVGSIWREPEQQITESELAIRQAQADREGRISSRKFAVAGLAGLLAAAIWPGLVFSIDQERVVDNGFALKAPAGAGSWGLTAASAWNWRPRILGTDAEFYRFYVRDGEPVGLYLGLYRSQGQDAELVNSSNVMVVQKHPEWSDKGETRRVVELDGEQVGLIQSKIVSPTTRLLVWHWYRIGDKYTSNPYVAKLLEAWFRLTGSRRDAAMIVLATPYEIDLEAGAMRLRTFADAMLPEMERVLDSSVGEGDD